MKAKIESSSSFEERVREIVLYRVRPHLLEHGGDLSVREIRGRDVGIVFSGACGACPAAQITVEQVVEKGLRRELGDKLGRVYLINETDDSTLCSTSSRSLGKRFPGIRHYRYGFQTMLHLCNVFL